MQKKLHVFTSFAGTSKYSLAWWKRHHKVYHLIARSQHELMVQILASLITHLLVAINCRNNYNEKVSVKRVRELILKIKNKAGSLDFDTSILTIHDGKGKKDRTVPLPEKILPELKAHLVRRKNFHQKDLISGDDGAFTTEAVAKDTIA